MIKIGWKIIIFMQLVEGLKDGPPSIFISPSKSKEQLIGGETKERIYPCSHWSKKKCQSWYMKGKWCGPFKMEKGNSFGDGK
jgi:hypothetical protein